MDHVGNSGDAEEVVRRAEESGGRALAVRVDATSPKDVEYLIGRTVKQFRRLDVMVTNAELERKMPFLEMPLEAWEVSPST